MDHKAGAVVGRVTTPVNGTVGVGGAYVAIVNALNVSEEYYNTTSDTYGNYQITGINATYNSILGAGSPSFDGNYERGANAYRVYANKDPYGDGCSAAFGIDEFYGGPLTSVVLYPMPVGIELRAERSHVTADDEDNVRLTAFAYDAQGNPVADGHKINFTIGSATDNNFTSNGNYDYVPGAMGRLGSPGNPFNFYQGITKNGSASVQFGWIDEPYSGNNSTIWAYSDDNASAFASAKVYSAAPMDALAGYVVDPSGAGIGGIPATMHVMGYDVTNQSYYEIYSMTRTTSGSPPSIGKFAFDYIVLTGAAYGYVDAEVRFADNRTVSGRSGNFSMDRSATAIGNITLDIQPSIVTTPEPSTTPKPTPGFEAPFALAASLGTAYLMARRERP